MDNWLFLLLGLLLGIPFSIVANFATPWVKSYFDKSSLSIRERRIHILLEGYKELKRYKEDSGVYIARLLRIVATMIFGVFTVSSILGTGIIRGLFFPSDENQQLFWVAYAATFLIVLAEAALYLYLSNFFNNVFNFAKSREKTLAKLKKLGGNPEDLDKIDKEIEKPAQIETKTGKDKRGK